jgi:hypothetical protein
MLPEILINIFWFLNNYEDIELVCSLWRECARKTRHSKILKRLNNISTKIKHKSNLITISKKLNTKYHKFKKHRKLVRLHHLTKLPISTWWDIDRSCQYITDKTIRKSLFDIFHDYQYTNEKNNIVRWYNRKTWRSETKNLDVTPFFSISQDDNSGKYFTLIHKKHLGKLKQIWEIFEKTGISHHFNHTSNEFRSQLYDRLLKINHKVIEKSCKHLCQHINDSHDFIDHVLVDVLGRKVYSDDHCGDLKRLWPRKKSDFTWFPLETMFCTFDYGTIRLRLVKLTELSLAAKFFDMEFKCVITFFTHMMKLDDKQFDLLISYASLNWDSIYLLPYIMLSICSTKLQKRFQIIKVLTDKRNKDDKIDLMLLKMNTSRLRSWLIYQNKSC